MYLPDGNVVGAEKSHVLETLDGRSLKAIAPRRTSRKLGVIKQSRRTPGRLFFITVSLSYLYTSLRSNFVGLFEDVTSYCSCVEVSRQSGAMTHHLHLFLEFAEPKFIEDIRSWVSIIGSAYGDNLRSRILGLCMIGEITNMFLKDGLIQLTICTIDQLLF